MDKILLYKLANSKLKEYANLEMKQTYALYHNLGVHYCAEGHILRGLKNRIDFLLGKYFLLKSQKNKPTYINYTFLGYIAYQKKKYKAAIKYYQMASQIMLTWECEYNLALSFYKNNQIRKAFLKIQKLYDMMHNDKIFIEASVKEEAFYLIDSFYFLMLAQNKISPFDFVEESYIFSNSSLDCNLYIGYFLKKYTITYRFLKTIFNENPRIDFEKQDYALMIDCLLKMGDKKLLKKVLSYYSDEQSILKLLDKLIKNHAYRNSLLAHIQLNPETAEFGEQLIFHK